MRIFAVHIVVVSRECQGGKGNNKCKYMLYMRWGSVVGILTRLDGLGFEFQLRELFSQVKRPDREAEHRPSPTCRG